MSSEASIPKNLTGNMLVAHPRLLDPNFRRTILFLSHHSDEDGAIGLILNRPLKKDIRRRRRAEDFQELQERRTLLRRPVAVDHLTLASLQWRTDPASVAFQSFMGNIEDVYIEPQWRSGPARLCRLRRLEPGTAGRRNLAESVARPSRGS